MSVYLWGASSVQEETSLPKQLIINFQVHKVSCGEEHLLLLSTTHQLYTMGSNNYGALGIGCEEYNHVVTTPALIASNVIDIDSGWNHSGYLNTNNSAFIWGRGHTIQDLTAPKQIASQIKMVKCGARHTMLINSENNLYSFGANDSGQCGVSNSKKITEPAFVMSNVTNIALGVTHSLIKSDQLFACGSNSLSQLGIPGIKTTSKPLPVEIGNVTQIAAGNHSAAISSGSLFVWGSGSFGTYAKPTILLTDMAEIHINGTLGLGVDSKSQLYSWGSNVNGELGVGNTNPYNEAVRVNLKNVATFDAGIGYAIAVVRAPPPVQSEREYLAKTLQIESEERSALEKINRELKLKYLEVEKELLDSKREGENKNEEIRHLQQRLSQLQQELNTTDFQSKDFKSQCHRYQAFQKEAIQKLQRYEETISQLEGQLRQKCTEVTGLESQLENFQVGLKNYQEDESQQLKEIKDQLHEISEQLSEEQAVNEQLKEELQNEKASAEQKSLLIQQYEFEIGNQLNNNKQIAQQMQSHLNQHQKLQEALSMAHHRIESLQTQNAKLMQELSLLRTSLYSDTQKSQVLEIQTVMNLNKELTELNSQLQQKIREKDQEIMKLRSNQSFQEMSRQSSQHSIVKTKTLQQQPSPNGKTISELLESAHKHAKFMKKILKEADQGKESSKASPSPKRKLEFSKENSMVKNEGLSDVRDRLNKLHQNRQMFEKKLRL